MTTLARNQWRMTWASSPAGILSWTTLIFIVTPFGHAGATPDSTRAAILVSFSRYAELHLQLRREMTKATDDTSDASYLALRKKIDMFHDVYVSNLRKAKEYVCSKADQEMLAVFLGTLTAVADLGDRYQRFALGEMYICQPDLLVSEFLKLPKAQQRRLYDAIEWGFMNTTYKVDEADYANLRERLIALRPKTN